MEIYQTVPGEEGQDSLVLLDANVLALSILPSGTSEDEAYAPYRISLWLLTADEPANLVRINSISANLNGDDIGNIFLFDIKSGDPVALKTDMINLGPAPCCVFMLISNFLDLVHVPDDILTVDTEICLSNSLKSECKLITKSFRAVVK